jgi:predicted phage baseplate assembly protein
VSQGEFTLWSWEAGKWVAWQATHDLLNASPSDSHFVLDLAANQIYFGSGARGRILPKDARLYAAYDTTHAQNGNLQKDVLNELVQDVYNRALLPSPQDVASKLKTIRNPIPATGGVALESLEELQARALTELARPTRAVTLTDVELLAKDTPGICLARVTAIPNLHPAYSCYQAPGVITVIVLPFLPEHAPQASPSLIRRVQAYLNARRVVGTRLFVTGPQYHAAAVRARIQAVRGADPNLVKVAVERALDAFFDPLSGGPSGQGWPFGRSIYRSEVLQVIDETPDVDHVLDLELIDEDGQSSCGNLCLRPLELVAAQPHEIEVM